MEGTVPVSQQGCRAAPSGQRALSHLQRIKEPSSDSTKNLILIVLLRKPLTLGQGLFFLLHNDLTTIPDVNTLFVRFGIKPLTAKGVPVATDDYTSTVYCKTT